MPLVLGLPAVGYGYAHWEWALPLQHPAAMGWVLVTWGLLSAGTLWLNAALDRDESEVLMGPAGRVELPSRLPTWAYGALLASVGCGFAAGPAVGGITLACAALAIAYSHPSAAWKGHPALGPAVNLVGYGVLSPMAGWVVVGAPPTPRTAVTAALLASWVGATYFAAQAHQADDDRARGYRTLVATHGPGAAVGAARVLYWVAVGGLCGFAVLGWYPVTLVVAAIPAVLLDRRLASWGGRGVDGGRAMLRRATAVAVTVMLAAAAQHGVQIASGLAPAGLGTPWHPE
ncbi:MAG: UbiA family prenyltransferase [Myxococcota bacterium]